MPKKRQQRALLIKPATSKPATFSDKSSTAQTDAGPSSSSTVNDLLRASRRDNAQIVSRGPVTGSIPPSVREVLALPALEPRAARTHFRGPVRLRRIPGPPPPQSWLHGNGQTASQNSNAFHQLRWTRARIQQESSNLPGLDLPPERSLEHLTLRAIALNWPWHADYDGTYLSDLPCSLRMQLLSYLAVYDEGHSPNPMPLLFPDMEDSANDNNLVTRLDLSNALGSWMTSVRKLEKELIKNITHPTSPSETEQIPDTWDDVKIPPEINGHARFPNLRHLSLALDPLSAATPPSWASLTALSGRLSRLTSLSLSNWPTPTYTPNASRGRVKIVDNTGLSGPQILGGTDMYSASENNWREAAGILRSLSRNLYCLTWLDLSGCGPWLPALTWKDEDHEQGPDWTGSWRNIVTLILTVGWTPGQPRTLQEFEASIASRSSSSVDSTRAIEQLYGHSLSIQTSLAQLSELRLNAPLHQPTPQPSDSSWNVEHEREKQYFRRDLDTYNAYIDAAQLAARNIREARKQLGGKFVNVEISPRLNPSIADI